MLTGCGASHSVGMKYRLRGLARWQTSQRNFVLVAENLAVSSANYCFRIVLRPVGAQFYPSRFFKCFSGICQVGAIAHTVYLFIYRCTGDALQGHEVEGLEDLDEPPHPRLLS